MGSQSIKGIAVAEACLFLYRAKQMLPDISIQHRMSV